MHYRSGMTWDEKFQTLFERCVAAYRGGNWDYASYYTKEDLRFLGEIGYKTREFFDFVEDHCEDGRPSASTALLIAAVRRDYFHIVQNGVAGTPPLLTRDDIPGFGESLHGIAYLPRVLAKARAKLRGALDPDLMYGCGGDRNFFRKHGEIHPADFLRRVWAAGEDDSVVAEWVVSHAR